MQSITIITNNPLVRAKYPDLACFHDLGVQGVLFAVRDRVHLGAEVLSHPLSGDVLPGVTPYRSIVVSDSGFGVPVADAAGGTDLRSVSLIENAIRMLKKPPAVSDSNTQPHLENPGYFNGFDDSILEDFQVIDLDLLDSAMISIL